MNNQKSLTHFTAAVLGLLFFIFNVAGQEQIATPTPTPGAVNPARKQSPRRVSNVKLTDAAPVETNFIPAPSEAESAARTAAENNGRLEREKATAVAEAEAKARTEAEAKQAEFDAKQQEANAKQQEAEKQAAIEKERLSDELEKVRTEAATKTADLEKAKLEAEAHAAELEKARLEAEARAAEVQKQADADKRDLEERTATEKVRLEAERVERERQAEAERAELAKQAEIARAEQEKQAETVRLEREKQAADERLERERIAQEILAKQTALQLEIDNQRKDAKIAFDTAEAESAARAAAENDLRLEREKLRTAMIEQSARSLKYLKPETAVALVPANLQTASEVETFLSAAAGKDESLVKSVDYCNTAFQGEPFSYTGTADVTLGDFLDLLSNQYRMDFVPDSEVLNLPIRLSVNNKLWNDVLRSQLNLLDVQATCDGGIISLVKRQKYLAMQETNRKTAPLKTETIRLSHLRVAAGRQVDLSGKANSTDPIATLEQALQKILQAGGDNRGTVAQIPNRAEFFIKATEDQLREIREQIRLADRPRYRVDVFGLIYVVNESKLKDVGSQLSVILSTGGATRSGGLTTLPLPTTGGTATTPTTATTGFPGGFSAPSGALGAGSASTIIGAQVNVGIADFRYQLSLLEQFGVARSIEKPFVSAKDGSTSVFDNGTKIPVVIQALNNFSGSSSGGSISYINAGTSLSVSPQIAFDENDQPKSVSLNMRLESNTPDRSIQTSGDIPAVNSRSIQLDDVTLIPGQAFIFGGSNNRIESNTVSRSPGLGEIPFLKNLFRRKNKQINDDKIYFAVTVQISEDNGSSPVNPLNLDTTFAAPPPMNEPLQPQKIQ